MWTNFPWDIIIAIFASSGFWAFITAIYTTRKKKSSAETRLLLGLAYGEIYDKCKEYIDRGYITTNEHEDLVKYLYQPYTDLGGDGTCKRLMQEVEKLPMK